MIKKFKNPYFPKELLFTTPIAFLFAMYLIASNYLVVALGTCLLGIVIGIAVLTTNYITEIDLRNGFYKDYLSIAGLSFKTEQRRFKKINKIVITRGRHQHTARVLGSGPHLVNWHEFTATVLYDQNGELELMTKKNKKKLIQNIKDLAEFLKVEVEDKSVRNPS